MALSHTIVVTIDVPFELAYPYLADPQNYADWAAVYPETYRQLDNGDWAAEVHFGGTRHIRFSSPNAEGILDHAVFRPDEAEALWMPMRAFPDGTRTELSFTFIQRNDMSPEEFTATIESISTDLSRLKAVLEKRFPHGAEHVVTPGRKLSDG